MKRGKTEVETCVLNNWNVGTVLRGHEEWSDGQGVWTTIRITAMGEHRILARCIRHERTKNGTILDSANCRDMEKLWTLNEREWSDRLDNAEPTEAGDDS